ncbi:MAG: hypothetical protein ACOYL5_14475 [Phototrophicaceae bacterium]|jgi:hypothetical protein
MDDWQAIREKYPHRWVVVEALNAHTEGDERIIEQVQLIAPFGEQWQEAWDHYKQLHRAAPYREYYMLHTDREVMDIGVLDAFGRTLP